MDTLHAALWAVAHSTAFDEAVLSAVNLGGDADTIGAVTGQIAGARWGFHAIPLKWRTTLIMADKVLAAIEKLIATHTTRPLHNTVPSQVTPLP